MIQNITIVLLCITGIVTLINLGFFIWMLVDVITGLWYKPKPPRNTSLKLEVWVLDEKADGNRLRMLGDEIGEKKEPVDKGG